ncbi:SDR family oxidoreductase [Agitococcus lubricus]|uniref:Short-subunit dehydrogenase n=1 Tax=Agitococcus lubricus TaxID=1077255 RepID=A0A2T5IYY7_9GAMM|nr:SDR family oxidoreductase [Agitococcus lubricus]PTQ89223.1 short-subunit dehydrogenase [Agitococcus lubricus]
MAFHRRVVWITGASSGIGEALAYEFAQQGARLVLSARRADALERVRANCQRPEQHYVLAMDMKDIDRFPDLVKAVEQAMGTIDLLINNAGVSQRSLVKDTCLAVDRELMEVDYFGPVALTKAVLPLMLARKRGRLVAVSSIAGLVATPMRSTYAAAKHALRAFYDALRAEVYDHGVYVSVIYPGFVKTNISIAALVGDGSTQNKMDDAQNAAMSPQTFAQLAVAALARGEEHIVIGGLKEKLAVYIDRASPELRQWLMRKVKVV